VLASRAVVAAIRLAIIFAGAFVVISVVALIARRQWLTKVGPVQVSEQVSDIDAENRRLKDSLENARETIDNLKQDLAESNRVLDQMMRDSGGSPCPKEQLDRRIQENKRAIEQAERVEERIDRTIRESDQRSERARAALRRAGYLREA
jgi:hypothetical protein